MEKRLVMTLPAVKLSYPFYRIPTPLMRQFPVAGEPIDGRGELFDVLRIDRKAARAVTHKFRRTPAIGHDHRPGSRLCLQDDEWTVLLPDRREQDGAGPAELLEHPLPREPPEE